jgi:XRE family transcriptional regulator, regulator of sulfur utilization
MTTGNKRNQKTPLQIEVGGQIKAMRKKSKLTMRQMAEKTGKTISTLSLIETGKANTTLGVINDIAQTCGMEINFKFVKKVNA